MILPTGDTTFYDELPSTQDIARSRLEAGESPGIVVAKAQSEGRGRRGRNWYSPSGDALCASFVFDAYAGHAEPWLIGMAVAVAIANLVDGELQWPNDVQLNGKKVAGILTEMFPKWEGDDVPIVGVGINLNQRDFPPEIQHRATSLLLETGKTSAVESILNDLKREIAAVPEPTEWLNLRDLWVARDHTPGKPYELATGEIAEAIEVGSSGELICRVGGEIQSVLAADAFWPDP